MNSNNKKIRLIFADDHELLRRGFQTLLLFNEEIELVTHVANGQQLFDGVKAYVPDMVITDIRMPVMDGIQATRLIKNHYPHIKVIALSSYQEGTLIEEMLNAGADGFLIKNVSKEELIESIHAVMGGKTYFCDESLKTFLKKEGGPTSEPGNGTNLSKREIEVTCLIAAGKSSREIAKELSISLRTVDWYRQVIKLKIGADNVVGIARYAIRHGICKKS